MGKYGKDLKTGDEWDKRREYNRRKVHSIHGRYLSDNGRHERPLRMTISISDIGECKLYVYERDYVTRKPCFYIKAIKVPFKTCIELFNNKYVKDASKNTLSDKQAEELYDYLISDELLPSYCTCITEPRSLYKFIVSQWSYQNYEDNVFKQNSEEYSNALKMEIPNYKLINQEE